MLPIGQRICPLRIKVLFAWYVTVSVGVMAVERGREQVWGAAKYRSWGSSKALQRYELRYFAVGSNRRLSAILGLTGRRSGYAELLHAAPQGVRVHPQNRRGATCTFDHAFRAFQHVDNVQALDIIE
jgi:hypothetical protein